MEGMKAYSCYMALKLHFTTDYNYFTYSGKLRQISEEKLSLRKDYHHFRRIERRYGDELESFIVANFMLNPKAKWAGDLVDIEAEKAYAKWKKNTQSLMYSLQNELSQFEDNKRALWIVENGNHPPFLKAYLGGKVSLFTIIICDEICGFLSHWKKEIRDTIIWPDVLRLIEKSRPFLSIDKAKAKAIMREVLLEPPRDSLNTT